MKIVLSMVITVFAVAVLVAGNGMYAGSYAAESSLSGKVTETMDSGGYTYVLIEKDGEKTWVAVPEMHVTKGKTITFRPGLEMINFHSKSLNRTFKKIFFSDGTVS